MVLANYGNVNKGIMADNSYLECFFKKLIEDSALKLKEMPKNIMTLKKQDILIKNNDQER